MRVRTFVYFLLLSSLAFAQLIKPPQPVSMGAGGDSLGLDALLGGLKCVMSDITTQGTGLTSLIAFIVIAQYMYKKVKEEGEADKGDAIPALVALTIVMQTTTLNPIMLLLVAMVTFTTYNLSLILGTIILVTFILSGGLCSSSATLILVPVLVAQMWLQKSAKEESKKAAWINVIFVSFTISMLLTSPSLTRDPVTMAGVLITMCTMSLIITKFMKGILGKGGFGGWLSGMGGASEGEKGDFMGRLHDEIGSGGPKDEINDIMKKIDSFEVDYIQKARKEAEANLARHRLAARNKARSEARLFGLGGALKRIYSKETEAAEDAGAERVELDTFMKKLEEDEKKLVGVQSNVSLQLSSLREHLYSFIEAHYDEYKHTALKEHRQVKDLVAMNKTDEEIRKSLEQSRNTLIKEKQVFGGLHETLEMFDELSAQIERDLATVRKMDRQRNKQAEAEEKAELKKVEGNV